MRHKPYSSTEALSTFQRLGERVRRARKSRGLTLTDLENRCGIHRSTLSRLEGGDIGVSFAVLADVLEVLGHLSDLEAILSSPEPEKIVSSTIPKLDSNF